MIAARHFLAVKKVESAVDEHHLMRLVPCRVPQVTHVLVSYNEPLAGPDSTTLASITQEASISLRQANLLLFVLMSSAASLFYVALLVSCCALKREREVRNLTEFSKVHKPSRLWRACYDLEVAEECTENDLA